MGVIKLPNTVISNIFLLDSRGGHVVIASIGNRCAGWPGATVSVDFRLWYTIPIPAIMAISQDQLPVGKAIVVYGQWQE